MSVAAICTRCLNPARGWAWDPGGRFECVDCLRHLHGDGPVDDAILYEHPELADDAFIDRLAASALEEALA